MASNLGEQVNPFDINGTEGALGIRPAPQFRRELHLRTAGSSIFGRANASPGWSISGKSTLRLSFPVTLYNNLDTSLLGTFGNGVNNNLLDTPNVAPGDARSITIRRKDRRSTQLCSAFRISDSWQCAAAFLLWPGHREHRLVAAEKHLDGSIADAAGRLEMFNVFNHPQFYGPGAVDGNITSATFGQIINAAPPRLVQLGAKFSF